MSSIQNPVSAFAIRFSDNDFNSTLIPWVESFVRMLRHRNYVPSFPYPPQPEKISKEYIESLFKRTIGSFYLMHQADPLDKTGYIDTINYLEEHPVHIFLNEEVGEYLTKCENWDNGEFYYWFFDPYTESNVCCV